MHFFQNFKLGFKKAWITDTLPENLINFQSNPLIRVFRVIGGISILTLINNIKFHFLSELSLYFFLTVSSLYFFYLLFFSIYRIFYIIKRIKNKDLEIRNSPVNRLASLISKFIYCAKGFCENTVPIGTAFGAMAGYDALLELKGHKPIFTPLIADLLISDTTETRQFKERKNLFKELSTLDERFALLIEENKIIEKMENSKIFTSDDISTLKEGLTNQEYHLLESKENLLKKIQDNLDSLSK